VASPSSGEELEEKYSGTSSVPRISSGSRSRLEKTRRGKHEIANESKNGLKENSLSNGTLLWWTTVLLDGLLSLVRHGLGVLSSGEGGRRCEMMEEYTSDLQGTHGSYFIDWESALGVMTGWHTFLEYQAAGFSSRMRRVFIEQCLWFPN
jgi:hypothetical protein